MTQPELADLIEGGFRRSEVKETLVSFICKRQDPEGKPTYGCCLLGAGLAELHGPEIAWSLWSNYHAWDFITLSAEQLGITYKLAEDIAHDHQVLRDARQAVLAKLRANQYAE